MMDAVDRYLQACRSNDAVAMAALFGENAEIEDPIGADPIVGKKAISSFFAIPRNIAKLRRIGPMTVFGKHVGVQFRAGIGDGHQLGVAGGKAFELSSTEIFTFDDDGLIARMVAIPDVDSVDESTDGRVFESGDA